MQRGLRAAAVTLAATMMLAGGAFAQRGGFGRGGGFGGGANMLRMPEVQAELKLTDDQKSKVTDLMQKLRDQQQEQRQALQDLSPEERQQKMADMRASEDKQLADVLNADQMKRYHQLELQRQGMTAVLDKPVADQLKLTDDEKTKIQGIVDEQRAAMRDLFQNSSGGDRQAMMQKMQDMRKQTDDKIAAVLTDDQKAQWKEMTGAPFTFPAPGPGGRRAAGA